MAKRSRRRRRKRSRRRRRRGAGFFSSTRRAPRACARAVGNFLNRSCKLDKFAFPTTREKAAKCFADDAMSEQREEGRQPTAADRQQALQGARELLREIEKDHQCIEQPVGVDGAPLYQLGAHPANDPAAEHMERQLAAFHGLSGGRRTRRRRRSRRGGNTALETQLIMLKGEHFRLAERVEAIEKWVPKKFDNPDLPLRSLISSAHRGGRRSRRRRRSRRSRRRRH